MKEASEKIQENTQKAIENDAVGTAIADTLVRAIPGGAIDAVEDTLSAAEVVGDTIKTFATLGNIRTPRIPFELITTGHNGEELGADEIGAQD